MRLFPLHRPILRRQASGQLRPAVSVSAFLMASIPASACPACRPIVAARVFDPHFAATLALLLLPLGLILSFGMLLLLVLGHSRTSSETVPHGVGTP